jgi:hypothetical protein
MLYQRHRQKGIIIPKEADQPKEQAFLNRAFEVKTKG